jgi:glycosyltransferase involved in cell wall biosynthesis
MLNKPKFIKNYLKRKETNTYNSNNVYKNNIKKIKLHLNNPDYIYSFNSNQYYFLSNKCHIDFNKPNLLFNEKINMFILEGNKSKDIAFTIFCNDDTHLKLFEIINNATLQNLNIGYSKHPFVSQDLCTLYYSLGKANFDIDKFGLTLYYNNYINKLDQNRKFNKTMMLICYSYFLGTENKNLDELMNILSKNIFHDKKCLLLSKLIIGFGGVQKTSRQLVETLDYLFDVNILSSRISNKKNNYILNKDQLCNTIHNSNIIKLKNYDDIINHINTHDYDYIFVNKLNEVFKFVHKLNKKINILVHNPMDPLNKIVIDNKKYINDIFVINNHHKNLLKFYNIENNCHIYHNYVFNQQNNKKYLNNKKFNNKICYIGRLSKEKNIKLLIETFNEFNKIKKNVKLFIIGDGNVKLKTNNKNIIMTGRLTFDQIIEHLKTTDYTISTSYTEGKPFSVIESMSFGIPCIHSNLNGINEIIFDNINGFTFDFNTYEAVRYNFDFNYFDVIDSKNSKNKKNLLKCLNNAYNIPISKWNQLSKNCIDFSYNKFYKQFCIKQNINSFNKIKNNINNNKLKIFVNFKPDPNVPHGGGNISVFYIIRYLLNESIHFNITYELENNIDIYFVIDVLKDRKLRFKKYGIEEITKHRNQFNKNSKIILRVNDCDITRTVNNNNSREQKIIKHIDNIDFMIFNSHFIKNYYLKKYNFKTNHTVVNNGCDQNMFFSKKKIINNKINIVTHHWSNNLNKGYETYLKLWKHLQNYENFDFIFIGKNVPDMFKNVPIHGPFVKEKLANELNKCHIYITDSRYDACPNHVIEAISCGLPILYSNVEGGAKELCQKTELKIGEMYDGFNDLLEKINMIVKNYNFYTNNINKCKHIFNINSSVQKYYNSFLKQINLYKPITTNNNIIKINSNENYIININEDQFINCFQGNTIFAISNKYNLSINSSNAKTFTSQFTNNNQKLDNDNVNVLLCSDNNYLVGLFATLKSVIDNVLFVNELHFNFIIDIQAAQNFTNLLNKFENKNNINLNKSIVYIDALILDQNIINSKCFNGGGHLLNIGNISRLLIGNLFNYKKLIYLDSDSIVQYDILEKLKYFELEADLYAPCANKINRNRAKQIVIKNETIINCDYQWKNIINCDIDKEKFCFMGAPFITNCQKWNNVYQKVIQIIKLHNSFDDGLFKLFTMSLQNIIFYNKTKNINTVLNVIQDLGSKRKNWNINDLMTKDVLDWSGIYKPWYNNGLYQKIWNKYDCLNLAKNYGPINTQKNITEQNMNNISTSTSDLLNANNYINQFNNNNSNYKFNLLYVCSQKYLIKKMSRVRFWAMEYLAKHNDVKLTLLSPEDEKYNKNISLQQNIVNLNLDFDLVIWYKPLDDTYIFDKEFDLPFKTCLRYNEMWDFTWTSKEINESNTDIIICHHKNDFEKYNSLYKNINKKFYYIPHQANPEIFNYNNTNKTIDILLSGVTKQKHYPLKHYLFNIIKKHQYTTLRKYKIHFHQHPGYNHNDSFTNKNQINYNKLINQSKLCVACTSKYNYRLGKYVEIPMSGSVILGDIPYEDKNNFNKFVVEVNLSDPENIILQKIINILENNELLNQKRLLGMQWAKNSTTDKYVDKFIKIINTLNSKSTKLFVIADELNKNHKEFKDQQWICDVLKNEIINEFPEQFTNNPNDATHIWYLAPWNSRYIPKNFNVNQWYELLKNKKVIFSQHHIDQDKLNQLNKQFNFMKKFGNTFHAICNNTKNDMNEHFPNKKIITKNLWINNNTFYHMNNKKKLKQKYNLPKKGIIIGSFQKDTEGNTNLPKLSKGPDIFIKIVKNIKKRNKNTYVVLTGTRRQYLMKELKKYKIKYFYFNMVDLKTINELYNCLDLYIVSSRCEGGPRSIFEAGLTKTPIISTKVGIAPDLMHPDSLFDHNDWLSYKNAKPNIEYLYNNVIKLSSKEYKEDFISTLVSS